MQNTFDFSVVLHPQEEGGFTVLVAGLPEVITEGDTEEEALRHAEEAIRLALEHRRDHGLPVPTGFVPLVRRLTIAA
jgi:antitoxin HicB